jgi:hypothetical protein
MRHDERRAGRYGIAFHEVPQARSPAMFCQLMSTCPPTIKADP